MKLTRRALISLTLILPALAQNSGDSEFAAPAPRTCAFHNLPQSGALTAAQARQYVICGLESSNSELFTTLGKSSQ